MPFYNNINPTLMKLGPFEIRFYGIVYVIGFLLIYYTLNKKRKELNFSKDDVDNFVLYQMLAVIIGSRLFHVLTEFRYYLSNPVHIFFLWQGGMAFHGGLIGVFGVTWYFCRKKKFSFLKMGDIIVIPAVFTLALGRIANFINGELIGTAANVPWCVYFKDVAGCRHPVQVYGAIKRFAIGALLVVFSRKNHKDGFLMWMFIFLMGLGRFFIDFMREDPRFMGLSFGQFFSIFMVIIGGIALAKNYRKDIFGI